MNAGTDIFHSKSILGGMKRAFVVTTRMHVVLSAVALRGAFPGVHADLRRSPDSKHAQ